MIYCIETLSVITYPSCPTYVPTIGSFTRQCLNRSSVDSVTGCRVLATCNSAYDFIPRSDPKMGREAKLPKVRSGDVNSDEAL